MPGAKAQLSSEPPKHGAAAAAQPIAPPADSSHPSRHRAIKAPRANVTTNDSRAIQPATIDRFDHEVLEFFVAWAPYGDPAEEDALPRFGMNLDRLRERLVTIVRAHCRSTELSADERATVSKVSALLNDSADAHLSDPVDRTPPHPRSRPR
jgi:hypothetical protein